MLFADLNNGILTLFGALVPHEDHAVRAGLGIQRKLRQAGMADRARVGLNSGEALYRIIASDLGTEVDVVGLMVHVAARVERLAPAVAVYLTGETQALTQRLIETRKAGRPTSRVRRRGRHLWRSRATGLGRTMPCDAFASALRDLFGISERDDEDRVRQRVAAMPGYLDSSLRADDAVFASMVTLMTPLVLVFEDVHWIDRDSEEVLRAVVRLTCEAALAASQAIFSVERNVEV